MPKNSRPDIQVLEDRITRLKAQLIEYKDLRLYRATKKRLASVSTDLEECVKIINEIVNNGNNNISKTSISAYDEFPGEVPSEFSDDGDLLDTFLLRPQEDNSESETAETYSSKFIVRTYADKLKECADELGCSSGILQVNQFCQLMNSWYQTRFTPTTRNPKFFFKASRIHEWVDLLMIAAGHAMHEGLFPAFVSDMNSWIGDLNTPKDQTWILPYSVMRLKNIDQSCCSQEAVLLEQIIKPSIYSEDFYPDCMDSVSKIVMSNSNYTEEDLEIETILHDCSSHLVVTSSFDIKKYSKE